MARTEKKRKPGLRNVLKAKTGAERLEEHRKRMRSLGFKRHELWVPRSMTREEKAVLQDWIEDILIDIRAAPFVEEETENA